MFSMMLEELAKGVHPETGLLKQRFDAAMTKKLAVVNLPPAFWTSDPKINPRADHLFWASLLIGDLERVELAISVIAAEQEEDSKKVSGEQQQNLADIIRKLAVDLLETISDSFVRQKIELEIQELLHEYFQVN